MTAAAIIAALALQPHPEGGWYREVYRSTLMLDGLPHGSPRHAATGIYFLLPAGTFSAWHRVRSDEVWHHYQGDPVRLHVIADNVYSEHMLGPDILGGERPQILVPANAWQAAEPIGGAYALCGCTVSPGFDFADFEMPPAAVLAAALPDHAAIALRLGKGGTQGPEVVSGLTPGSTLAVRGLGIPGVAGAAVPDRPRWR